MKGAPVRARCVRSVAESAALAINAHYEHEQGGLTFRMAEHDHNAATNALTNAREQLARLREQEAFIKRLLMEDEQTELLLKCFTNS